MPFQKPPSGPRPVGTLLVVFALAAVAPASAHPLFRIHVRPAAYRIAPPRLPQIHVFSAVRQAVGLASEAASLASKASVARAVIAQAPARALLGRR